MKKLMIMLGAIVVAGVVNANAFAWTFYTQTAKTTLASWNDDAKNMTAYIVLDGYALNSYDSVAQLAAAASMGDTANSTLGSATGYSAAFTQPNTRQNYAVGTFYNSTGVAASGSSQDFYYVLVDQASEKYWVSGKMSATTYNPDASPAEQAVAGNTYNDIATLNEAVNVYSTGANWKSFSSSGGGDVPEPTSGLLLVLGGAMLALRRRRA